MFQYHVNLHFAFHILCKHQIDRNPQLYFRLYRDGYRQSLVMIKALMHTGGQPHLKETLLEFLSFFLSQRMDLLHQKNKLKDVYDLMGRVLNK